MAARPRTAPALLLTALTLLVVGCGGGGGDQASSATPVDQLLRQTFSGEHPVSSGKLDVSLRVDAPGSSQVQGPIALRLAGPFETQGKGKLPKFKLDASVQGAGQDVAAGVTSTGDQGFVRFQGTDYALSDSVFRQFKAGFEQAQAQAKDKQGQSLASLGIDPRRWLTDPRNAGEAKVGDADTIRITGGVDVPKLLDDVNTLLAKAQALSGSAGTRVPQKLTDRQKQEAAKAVKRLDVEIYTGKADSILRRLVVDLAARAPQGGSAAGRSANVKLDLQLLDVNQGQDIAAPSNAKPLDELLKGLGGLGLGSGSASGGGSSGGASTGDLQKYSQCIADAGQDAAKARRCADLLAP
jgi:hypothetical protein